MSKELVETCLHEYKTRKDLKVISYQDFSLKGKEVFKDKYDYSFVDKNEYIILSTKNKLRKKVKLLCKKHNEVSSQYPLHHLNGIDCCKFCRGNTISKNKTIWTYDSFLDKSKEIHGDAYNYNKDSFTTMYEPITITCKQHGEFKMIPFSHICGKKCQKCSHGELYLLTKEEYLDHIRDLYGDRFNYESLSYTNISNKISIECKRHGKIIVSARRFYNGSNCPRCKETRGESLVEYFLTKMKINFIFQKKFDECIYINRLVFDFYLPDFNSCIEYNGYQHYFAVDVFGGESGLIERQKRDKVN